MAPLTLPPICLCLYSSSPSFKRDPFSIIPSILPSFSLVDGNECFALQGWLFVETGDIGQDCSQAGIRDSGDAVRLGQQPGDKRLFRRLVWEMDTRSM